MYSIRLLPVLLSYYICKVLYTYHPTWHVLLAVIYIMQISKCPNVSETIHICQWQKTHNITASTSENDGHLKLFIITRYFIFNKKYKNIACNIEVVWTIFALLRFWVAYSCLIFFSGVMKELRKETTMEQTKKKMTDRLKNITDRQNYYICNPRHDIDVYIIHV